MVFGRRNRLRLALGLKKPAEHVIQSFACSLEPKHPLGEIGVFQGRWDKCIDPLGCDFCPCADECTLGVGLVLKGLPDSTSIDQTEVQLANGDAGRVFLARVFTGERVIQPAKKVTEM
jgi:hypothetical protein